MQQRLRGLDASITNAKNQQDKKREAMDIYMANLPENDKETKEEAEKVLQQAQEALMKAKDMEREVRENDT